MSLLKDTVIEAIRRMPENVTAKDITSEIRLIDHMIEDLKSSKRIIVEPEELLKRINLKIPKC